MFVSRARSGPICLRCQLHLARSAFRQTSITPRRRLHTDQDGSPYNGTAVREQEDGRTSQPSSRPPRQGQFFKKKGSRILMKEEELGTGILGKPAHAIVMSNRGRVPRKDFPVDENLAVPVEHVDLAAMMEKEDSTPGLDEVLQNIDELKPEHLTVSSREFDSLKDILLHGFTAAQLASYIRKLELLDDHVVKGTFVDLPKGSPREHETTYPWILAQGQWVPEVVKGEENTDPDLRGYLKESMTPKEKLVVRLMRQYWELSIQEVMAVEGHLDIRVREPEFSLLTLGTQQHLREIARRLLSPGRQIEIIPSEATVRVVAPKAIAETVLTEINGTLQNVQSKVIDTQSVSSTPVDPALLAEVARLTNSVVTPLESGQSIRVTWVNDDGGSSDLEDLGDRIFRLLLTSEQQHSSANKLLVYPSQHASAGFVVEYGGKEKMAWRDRLDAWARWSAPRAFKGVDSPCTTTVSSTRAGIMSGDDFSRQLAGIDDKDQVVSHPKETKSSDDPVFAKPLSSPIQSLLDIRVEAPEAAFPGDEPAPNPRGWSPLTTTTTAVFGHLLHQQPTGSRQIIRRAPINEAAHRILSPTVPPLFSLDPPGKIPPSYLDSTILMRFLPAPDQAAGTSSHRPPSLELAINIREPHGEEGYISGVTYLRAVRETHVVDVCLPEAPVDFRLTQTRAASLVGDVVLDAPGTAALHEFLARSRLEPQHGKLETPARLRGVGLPRHLFAAASDQETGGSSADGHGLGGSDEQQQQQLVEADYIFAGLEVRRALETTLDGWRLVYTSVEAGQGGGQRAELSLGAAPGWDWALARAAGDVTGEAFLDSAYRLAEGKLLAWAEV